MLIITVASYVPFPSFFLNPFTLTLPFVNKDFAIVLVIFFPLSLKNLLFFHNVKLHFGSSLNPSQ